MNPDVLVIGAGPVGLFSAIETKLLNPDLHIKILERNTEYSRSHILRLEKKSLAKSEAYKQYAAVRKLKGFVPTSEIEGTFLEIAEELGIEIERGTKIEDAHELYTQYPSTKTIIGADGAHSTVRKQLFDDKKIVDKNLQYIVEIKYKVEGATKRLPPTTYGPALGQVKHLVSENVGKEKEGETPVSLFIFVDEETYNLVREQPNALVTDLSPTTAKMEQLLNTIQPWLSLRKVAVKEKMILGSEKINGVALNVYQSECFAKELEGKNVYLVGDAAAAVPYFRALNAGLISAQETAKVIALSDEPDFEALNKTLSKLATNEIKQAHKSNNKVNFGRRVNSFLSIASKLTTGSLLGIEEESAMLNARATPPNIFMRHPRTSLGIILFLMLSGALIPAFIPIIPMLGAAILAAVGIAAASVMVLQVILKIMDLIKEYNNPVQPLPAFPWEPEEEANVSAVKLSALSVSQTTSNAPVVTAKNASQYPPLFSRSVSLDINDPSTLSYKI